MANQKLTVFRGSTPSNTYVWSPFVIKLEARLRFASVPYTLGAGSPLAAPKGKIPYVDVDGQLMGDSTLIIRDLLQRGVIPRDDTLTPLKQAQDLAVRALMEDKVYFYGTREKWVDNYQTMVNGVMGEIPSFVRWIVGLLAYRKVARTLDGQGTGLLSGDDIAMLREEVWEAVDALLTEAKRTTESRKNSGGQTERDPFWVLGGESPTEADATLYGFVAGALICDA